ncbi:hypothetical protein WJX79_007515 [Trebouxia sp. C0005]|nr:MAG: 10 kDa photosystem II polypeptide [Trebouxia sp. A1-2]
MAATMTSQKAFLGNGLQTQQPKSRRQINTQVQANKGKKPKKMDDKQLGMSAIKNAVVKNNLMGVSEKMNKKGWTDSQGRKGKGFGVYRYASKYGANVDGYSPIYTPDTWSESGSSYSLGTKGLIAWAGLVVVLLGVGLTLILTTSQV